MKTAITISLLPNSPQRPFVLGPDPREGFRIAADLGFDAVEIFPPSLESLREIDLAALVKEFGVPVSTIGTGGGAVQHGWTLTDDNPDVRHRARDYISEIIKRAGDLNASAIIGSMQGRTGGRAMSEVLLMLVESLHELGQVALTTGKPFFFEPLNRYESDLANTLETAAEIVSQSAASNLYLLADLFHMNIEESNPRDALRRHASLIRHIHFVDSNRWPAGSGHTNMKAMTETLREIGYSSYLAVEAFPLPTSLMAAKQAMKAFEKLGIKQAVNK